MLGRCAVAVAVGAIAVYSAFAAESPATLQSGQMALQDGFPERAERFFEFYIRKTTNSEERAEGLVWLGRALLVQGKSRQAVEALAHRQGPPVRNSETAAGLVYWLARARFELGDYPGGLKTLDDFKSAWQTGSYGLPAERLRAQGFSKLQQWDRAGEVWAGIEKRYAGKPEAADCLLEWAEMLASLGKKEDAVKPLRRLVEQYPTAVAADRGRLLLAGLWIEVGKAGDAVRLFQGLADITNALPAVRLESWLALAQLYEGQTNLTAAAEAVSKAAPFAPRAADKLRVDQLRGRLLIKMGRVDEGVALLKSLVQQQTTNPSVLSIQLDMARLLLERRLFARAVEEFQNYLEVFSDPSGRAQALMGMGWSLWGLGRYAEASVTFQKAAAAQTDPRAKRESELKAADASFAAQQYTAALDIYRRLAAATNDPAWALQVRYQAAECQAQVGALAGAETDFRELMGNVADPTLALKAAVRLAQLKEKQGQWDAARAVYDEVLRKGGPFQAQALHGRGMANYRQGRFAEAREDFERIMREFPKSELAEPAFFLRGWALYLLGRDEEALSVCREFSEKYPQSSWAPDVLFWLGEYFFNHGRYQESEQQFMGLVQKHPKALVAADALYWAGRSAAAGKEYVRAIEHFNQLAASYPDSRRLPETRFAQGDALSELGQFAGAILAFEEIIKKFPDSDMADRAWGRKGDCQFTLGNDMPTRYAEALESYRMVLQSPTAAPDLKGQAEYKMGRCKEKMKLYDDALEHYMNVVYAFLAGREKSGGGAGDALWFTRAAFGAAGIRETQKKWGDAVKIYRRVVDAGVPAAAEAGLRIEKIRAEQGG